MTETDAVVPGQPEPVPPTSPAQPVSQPQPAMPQPAMPQPAMPEPIGQPAMAPHSPFLADPGEKPIPINAEERAQMLTFAGHALTGLIARGEDTDAIAVATALQWGRAMVRQLRREKAAAAAAASGH